MQYSQTVCDLCKGAESLNLCCQPAQHTFSTEELSHSMPTLDYYFSPTVEAFILSSKKYNIICGIRGCGKTVGGLFRAVHHSMLLPRDYWPLKWAVVRDTRKNLGNTTATTIRKMLPEPYGRWRGKPEEPESFDLYLGSRPKWVHLLHFDFFGINSPADHDRFQSYEATGGGWIEEPCPLRTNTEFLSSGVAESALATLVTCLRGAPNPTIQLSMNPPSADHWTAQLFHLPGYEVYAEEELEMEADQMVVRNQIRANTNIFMVPPSENAAEKVTPGYVEQNRQILLATGNRALYARLVEGRLGYVDVGLRVTPEFNGAHIAQGLRVIPHVPLILAWDFGLFCTCIAAQVSPQGHLLIFKAWSRENMGVEQLCNTFVHPWLVEQPTETWWYCGGHEARQREQSNSEETALRKIVQKLGVAPYKPAPVSWSARRDAMKEGLKRPLGGMPWIRIDQQGAAMLVRCLDGGWVYEVNASERVRNETVPPKGRFSHLGDAFAALCAVLLRKTDAQSRSVQKPRVSQVRYPVYTHAGSSRTGV